MVKLTPREQEVLGLVIEGLTDNEICKELFIEHCTVRTHIDNIASKFGISGNVRVKMIGEAQRNNILNNE